MWIRKSARICWSPSPPRPEATALKRFFEGDEKWSLAASVGNYRSETAGAVGAFYKPAENVMMNVRGSFGTDENMVAAGVAVSLNKGDVPGVTKRQLANTVNAQAGQIQMQFKIALLSPLTLLKTILV